MRTTIMIVCMLLSGTSFGRSNQELQAEATRAKNEARRYTVSMECRLEESKNHSEKDWRTSYGSYSESRTSGKVYSATVRNQSETDNKYTLVWYYIGRADGSKQEIVVETGTKTISVPAHSFAKELLESDTYEGSKAVYRALGEKDESGVKIKGIVVQLIIDDKVVSAYYSLQQWQHRAWVKPFSLD